MIVNIINSVAIIILAIALITQAKKISNLRESVRILEGDFRTIRHNRNLTKNKEQEIDIRNNREMIEKLADGLDKKIVPKKMRGYTMYPPFNGYTIVNLTESEKRARELRKELEELEEMEK